MHGLDDGFDEILETRKPRKTEASHQYAALLHHLRIETKAGDLIDLYGSPKFRPIREWLVNNVGTEKANEIMEENL